MNGRWPGEAALDRWIGHPPNYRRVLALMLLYACIGSGLGFWLALEFPPARVWRILQSLMWLLR